MSLGSPTLWGGLFASYAAFSLAWSPGNKSWATAQLLTLITAYLFGLCFEGRRVWFWWMVFVAANVAVAGVEWYRFGFEGYGVFGNPNYFGCVLVLCLAAAFVYSYWAFLPIFTAGLVLTQSRGALFAAGVVFLIALWHRAKALALMAIPIALLLMLGREGSHTFWARFGIWQDTINHITLFGAGFGGFQASYEAFAVKINMTGQIAPHAYNDLLELVFELGVGAIFGWIFLAVSLAERATREHLICVAFFVAGLSYFPLWVIGVGHMLAFTLGNINGGHYGSLASYRPALS